MTDTPGATATLSEACHTPVRILGLVEQKGVSNFRTNSQGKNAGLFAALDRRFGVVGMVAATLPPHTRNINLLRNVHLNRETWRSAADLNAWALHQRTRLVEQQLQQWEDQYDVIVQLHGLIAPGVHFRNRSYVIHIDNTMMLSERHYPRWMPLQGRAREAALDFERELFQHAAFLLPRSNMVRDSMIHDYGCNPAQVITVGGGINFAPSPRTTRRYDEQIALFVGGDFARKGGQIILRAWPQVRRHLPEAQLWIVGPKKPQAAPQPGVHWWGHIKSRERLGELYMQATAFVMPSVFEPWGLAFQEAMAHGLPCIGADHLAMPEIIRSGENGLLVEPDNAEALAEALMLLLKNPDQAAAMGQRAYAEMLQCHTWHHVVARMAPYIEAAAHQPAASI